jgi:hypothetical protein
MGREHEIFLTKLNVIHKVIIIEGDLVYKVFFGKFGDISSMHFNIANLVWIVFRDKSNNLCINYLNKIDKIS